MKKLYIILVIAMFFACDLQNESSDNTQTVTHAVVMTVSGDAPMIETSLIDGYYYGLQYGVNLVKTTSVTNTEYITKHDVSLMANKMTNDSTTLSASISVDGSVVASDSTTTGAIDLSYTIEDVF